MILTAFMLGLAGSLHCVGMCSPLVMAVSNLKGPQFVNRLVYNMGRIFSYGLLGLVAATFGSLFQFSGFQNAISTALGALLILGGILGLTTVKIPLLTTGMLILTGTIKKIFSKFLSKKTISSLTLMGMLNGVLPCGLTSIALAYCISLSTPQEGLLFMLIFGLATLPVMLGLTSIFQIYIKKFNFSFHKVTTVTMILLGILLISRSLLAVRHSAPDAAGTAITICQ